MFSLAPSHLGSSDDISARNTVSVVESITPQLPRGVTLDIVGGDTYVRIQSQSHSVTLPGYEGEPYVRISESGKVEVNDASATSVLNGDRYGNVDLSSFTPSDTPLWRTVATDGMVMWHDHRVHWMSPQKPAVIDSKGTVLTWEVPFTVDSVKYVAKGSLYLREQASVMWWMCGAIALAIALFITLGKSQWSAFPVIVTSLLGVFIGGMQYYGLPVGAHTNGVLMWFSVGAVALTAASFAASKMQRATYASGPLIAGAGVTLVVAALMNAHQVRAAYIPGISEEWLLRMAVPVLLGTGVVATINGVMRAWRPLND